VVKKFPYAKMPIFLRQTLNIKSTSVSTDFQQQNVRKIKLGKFSVRKNAELVKIFRSSWVDIPH
jgi:hypothetical protein